MRRADRLFQIVQLLRRERAVTAALLARELEVSERTIYRDVQDLVVNGVPIQGEAGVGYALPAHFDLPPLMFDREEIQALVLGARMVASWSDERLARAAKSALAKVEHVLPPKLAQRAAKNRLYAPDFFIPKESLRAMETIRAALDEQRVLRIGYRDEHSATSVRNVRPLALSFWGRSWTLTAWCELRTDFRNFRLDRVDACEMLARRFEEEPGRTFEDFLARLAANDAERTKSSAPAKRANDDAPIKTPQLELLADERRALRKAKLRARDLATLSADVVFHRTGGAIERERCAEFVALAEFQQLGSIGPKCAQDLVLLGMRRIADLAGRDPNELYRRLCELTHTRQDPCVEDVLRCAVAQADHPNLPAEWREWHRWTPHRGTKRGALPSELRGLLARS